MKDRRTTLMALLALAGAIAAEASESKADPGPQLVPTAALVAQTLLDAMREASGVPGLGAAVVKHGQLVWQGSSGWRDIVQHRPVDADTRFRLASVSKLFTATALARLAQDGLIDPQAPLSALGDPPPMAACGLGRHHARATGSSHRRRAPLRGAGCGPRPACLQQRTGRGSGAPGGPYVACRAGAALPILQLGLHAAFCGHRGSQWPRLCRVPGRATSPRAWPSRPMAATCRPMPPAVGLTCWPRQARWRPARTTTATAGAGPAWRPRRARWRSGAGRLMQGELLSERWRQWLWSPQQQANGQTVRERGK
jgi:hypothetical protein